MWAQIRGEGYVWGWGAWSGLGVVRVGREVRPQAAFSPGSKSREGPVESDGVAGGAGAGDYRRMHITDASVRPCDLT